MNIKSLHLARLPFSVFQLQITAFRSVAILLFFNNLLVPIDDVFKKAI